jgi:hypothetical protein
MWAITTYWPLWIKNPDRVKSGKAAQMIRAEQKEQECLDNKFYT